ncbi:MAG: O-antigen ligase family protein, partial [Planctomycetes bacterium]|nr:O-antigen ligase family protein [Planctomycetota bacterium]
MARMCLLAVVTAAPWLFGGVSLSVQWWLSVGVLAALLCWLAGTVISMAEFRRESPLLPVTIVPLSAALFLGAFQLLPVGGIFNRDVQQIGRETETESFTVVQTVTPTAAASQGVLDHSILSYYPASTRLEMSRLVMAVIVFSLGALLLQKRRYQLWLWGVLALNGAALAFFGIAQKLSWNGRLFWTFPVEHGSPFASFGNRNNAAGFLNLCLAGGIGLVFWTLLQKSRGGAKDFSPGCQSPTSDSMKTRQPRSNLVSPLFAVVLLALMFAGILCTVSRGGILATTVAGLLTLLVLVRTNLAKKSLLGIGVSFLLGLGLIYWLGFGGHIEQRMSTLADERITEEVRLKNWIDATHAAADFWGLGTGLGTYRYAYQPYQTHLAESWFYNAENQYLEALVEGGIVGLGLMITT